MMQNNRLTESKIIGLTGGIGCGKSTVSDFLKAKSYAVIDADKIAHQILKEKRVIRAVINSFGSDILAEDDSIDRKALAKIVFADDSQLKKLEAITHPVIVEQIKEEIQHFKKLNEQLIFLDAALLFEIKLDTLCDKTITVTLSPEVQLTRILARGGIEKAEAKRRIAAQIPLSEKEDLADYVINNNGSLQQLYAEVLKVIQKLSI